MACWIQGSPSSDGARKWVLKFRQCLSRPFGGFVFAGSIHGGRERISDLDRVFAGLPGNHPHPMQQQHCVIAATTRTRLSLHRPSPAAPAQRVVEWRQAQARAQPIRDIRRVGTSLLPCIEARKYSAASSFATSLRADLRQSITHASSTPQVPGSDQRFCEHFPNEARAPFREHIG